jgi:hypothetical protein
MSTAESFTESTKPYPLSENDIIVFDGNKASFSGEAAKNIKDAISKMSINLSEIARTVFTLDQTIRLTHLHIWQALRDNPAPKHLPKHSLLILLRSLKTRGVITLPAGEALEIFLEKPIEPYLLSDGDIILCSGNTASFSEDAAARIVDKLEEMGVTQTRIDNDAKLSSGSARLILKKKPLKPIRKEGFYDFLHALITNGVIKLPEGQTPETLLTVIIEPYLLSDGDIILCGGNTASFSEDAAARIVDKLKEMGVTQTQIERDAELISGSAWLILKKKPRQPILKERFDKFLNALITHGVIKLPEGQERQPLSPYPLSDRDIVFKGQKVSLSKTALRKIQGYIAQNQLEQTIIDELYTTNNLLTHSLLLTLRTTYYKQTFAKILVALMEHEVIQLPEDQHLGQLLDPKSASSCTPTSKTLNTAQNCAALGGGGREIPALTTLLTTLPPAHIDHDGGR